MERTNPIIIESEEQGYAYIHDKPPPDIYSHPAEEPVVVNPKIVDIHASSSAGWINSMFLDAESERSLLDFSCYLIIAVAVVVYITLHFLPSAYGRYASRAFGILIPSRLAWFLEDLPAVVIPLLVFFNMDYTRLHLVNYLLLAMFLASYIQRALVYPVLIKGGKPVPSIPFLAAFAYNSINGYIQARYLTRFAYYPPMEILSVHFLAGAMMFVLGIGINWQSDAILRGLRSPLAKGSIVIKEEAMSAKTIGEVFDKDMGGRKRQAVDAAGPGGPMPGGHVSASRTPLGSTEETGYKIPRGGMFEFVSCANFFGEIVEWWGFAMASWSLPALAHAIFTTGNLVPRALQHHQDYLNKFREEYPKDRMAVIPYIL